MTFESVLIFVVSLIVYWIKPGPSQAAIITRALNDGFIPAFAIAVGAMVAGVIYFIIAAFGIAEIYDNATIVAFVLKIVGAGYFIYLGYQGLINIEAGQWTGKTDRNQKRDIAKNFTAGFIVELSSPITIFYFIGLLPTLIPIAEVNTVTVMVGSIIILYAGLLTYALIISLAVQVKETLSHLGIVKKINIVTSVSFILIGAFLFYSAVTKYNGAFAL